MRATSPSSVPPVPNPRRGRRVALAGVLVVAFLVGGIACSSTEEPSGADGGSTATTAATSGEGGGSTSTTADSQEPTSPGSSTPAIEPADHGPLPSIELNDREQAYVDALMQEPPEGMDDEQARCIAGTWIQAIGVEAIEAGGITPESIEAGTNSINDIPADRPTAEKVVDAYEACEFDLTQLVIAGFSSMAAGDPAKLACLEQAVTAEVAREYMILAVMASATDGNPDLVEIQRIIEPCVT